MHCVSLLSPTSPSCWNWHESVNVTRDHSSHTLTVRLKVRSQSRWEEILLHLCPQHIWFEVSVSHLGDLERMWAVYYSLLCFRPDNIKIQRGVWFGKLVIRARLIYGAGIGLLSKIRYETTISFMFINSFLDPRLLVWSSGWDWGENWRSFPPQMPQE